MSRVTPCSYLVGFYLLVAYRFHPDRLLASTAAAQHGVLNTIQSQAAGVTEGARRYRRKTGRYEQALPKVDRIGGVAETWEQQIAAALLWAGEDSAASHRCAAALWAFDSCPPGTVEITTPRRNLRSEAASHIVIHRYQVLAPEEIRRIGPLDVTAPARTLLDLAAVVRPDQLERAMDSALRRKQVTLPELRLTLSLNARRGRRGVRAFRKALDLRDGTIPPHRGLETRLWRLIRSSDLPTPLREYPVIENGKEIYRIDFAYPNQMLAIEADSWKHHSDRISWSKDQGRGNVLTVRGWRHLHFTHEDETERPDEIIGTIRSCL